MMAAMLKLSQAEAESSFQEKMRLEGTGTFVKLDSLLQLDSRHEEATLSSSLLRVS
jgi:hypothetical protein